MNTAKLQFKSSFLSSASLAILLTLSGHASAQAIPANCQALIKMRNDLWFVKPDTSPPFQLTHDGQQKFTIGGVSPDGKMIAYLDQPLAPGVSQIDKEEITLLDVTGKLLSKINLHTQGGIIGLTWINAHLLQVAEHIGPNGGIFHFVEVPSGGLHPISLQQLSPIEGISCTPSPNYRDMACIPSLQMDGINLNESDRDIYSTTDPFISATVLQTLDIAVGSVVTTATVPPFQIEATEIADGQVGLKVVTPDDLALGQPVLPMFVAPDYTMPVPVGGDINDDIPPTMYGFTAAIKHPDPEPSRAEDAAKGKGDKKPAIVTVRVLKSVTGDYSIEGDLAWSPDGSRIAAVEKNDLGQRWLVLLNSRASAGKDGARGEDRDTDGNIDAREPLPIKGPISRIDFTSDTHIRVEGEAQIFEQDIPAHGKLRDASKYTLSPSLPKQFSIDNMFVPIYGWVCQ